MRIEIARLHQAMGNTMVYVTHDQTEAMTLASRSTLFEASSARPISEASTTLTVKALYIPSKSRDLTLTMSGSLL